MQLSQISLALTRLGGVPFGPASLFAAGEQGAWYDPSDLTTLFQESSGVVTPVTAVEQSVYLMLDKSKGLVLGSELVTNGGPGFTATTGWTTSNATVTASGGKLVCSKTGPSGAVYWTLTTVIGTWYKVDISWENVDATGPSILVNSSGGLSITTSNTTATVYFLAVATSTFVQMQLGSGANGTSTRIISLSAKTVAGNHAYQSTSASRPVLRALYNLLTYTEQFDNAAWTKGSVTVTANAAVAPDGTTTADLLYPSSTGTFRWAYQTGGTGVNLLTWSIYAKAQNKSIIYTDPTGGGTALTYFNLATGQVGTVAAGYTASMSAVGNGWYRCTLTNNSAAASSFLSVWGVADANGSTTATANGTDGIYIWGAQLIVTNSLLSNAYQRVVVNSPPGSGVYDSAGFLPYLAFNGTNSSMLTNSVDFTATDKMTVWAGLRKLSDAQSIINELSSSIANAGSYALTGADLSASGAKYGFYLDGTTISGFSASTYTAPTTNVLSVAYDIAGAARATEIYPRINGVIPTLTGVDSASAGTGNFANAPLYIGRRNNATLPLNGNLYSLIIRGAQSSAAQISATEAWVNQKTAAY